MFLLLIQLIEYLGGRVPFAFHNLSTRMMLSIITSLLFTILLGTQFIRKLYALKIGQTIRSVEECPMLNQLHGKKKDTPTMGGLLILSSLALSLFLWMDLTNAFTWLLLFTTVSLGILGGVDDYLKIRFKNSKGLPARWKFLGQMGVASLVMLYLLVAPLSSTLETYTVVKAPVAKEFVTSQEGKTLSLQEYMGMIYLPFVKTPILQFVGVGLICSFVFGVFVLIGSSNAVNLTDGLDGLATVCVLMVSALFAFVAFLSNHIGVAHYLNILYIEGSGEIAVYLLALCGACLGFLWYNGHPAQIFMGDVGSLSLGGVLGLVAILLRREFLLALVGGVFVAEALSVMIQVISFRWKKRRVFLCTPLHHHFEYMGWPETKVVIRFWIIAFILAMLGLISLKFQ